MCWWTEYSAQKSFSLIFMKPLIKDMTQMDPSQRPTIDQAVERFEKLRASLSAWTLRSMFVYRYEFPVATLYRICRHCCSYRRLRRSWTTCTSYPSPPLSHPNYDSFVTYMSCSSRTVLPRVIVLIRSIAAAHQASHNNYDSKQKSTLRFQSSAAAPCGRSSIGYYCS